VRTLAHNRGGWELCYLKAEFINEFARVVIMAVRTKWSGQFEDVRISTIELYRVSN